MFSLTLLGRSQSLCRHNIRSLASKASKAKGITPKNFQATFNAPSAAFFKGGHFQETTISMTLRENELLNKKDIQDGF